MRHGPVSAPVHAVSALACAGAIGSLPSVGLQAQWVLIAGALGLLVIWSNAVRGAWARAIVVFRMTAWCGAVGWLAYVLAEGWSVATGFALVAGAALAGVLARPAAAAQRAADRRRLQATAAYADQAEQDRLHNRADHWIRRIREICDVNVTVLGIEDWHFPGADGQPRKTGFTLELRLPANGATWRDIAAHVVSLATAEDLPNGCGVEVQQGQSRQRVLMHVNTVDALKDDIPLPISTTPSSIYDGQDIGVRRDGSRAMINIRYDAMVMAGGTGSGKSNEIQTVLARLIQCKDVLPLVIDKNGGGIAHQWLALWAKGELDTPPIYWVADTDEEALLMTRWLQELIGARKRSQAAAMRAANDDKVPVSATVPQLVLVTDESGSLPSSVMNAITDISDRGRGSGIRTVTCGLRGTAEYLPTALMAQARVRVAMRANEQRELGYFYNWTGTPDIADTPAPGYGHVGVEGDPPFLHKGYRTTPDLITAVARAAAPHRPANVERESLALLPPEIRRIGMERWNRTSHITRAAADGTPAVPATASTSTTTASAAEPAPSHPGGMNGALDDLAAARRQLEETVAQTGGDQAFEDLVADLRSGIVPELIIRVLTAMGDAERMHTAAIASAVGVPTESLGSLLSQVDIRPLKNAFTVDGRPGRGRGYARADVDAAAERIRAGEQPVPDEVARWRPAA